MATQSKYEKSLLKSQEEKDQEGVSFKVKEAELTLQSDILATQKSLGKAKQRLTEAKEAYPLNTPEIQSAKSSVEGLEEGLKFLEALKEELFRTS